MRAGRSPRVAVAVVAVVTAMSADLRGCARGGGCSALRSKEEEEDDDDAVGCP